MSEILLGVQPVPQPSPPLTEGGDCFACATAAISAFYGRPLTVAEAREAWIQRDFGNESPSNTWFYFPFALAKLGLRATFSVVKPDFSDMDAGEEGRDHYWSWAFWFRPPVVAWLKRLEEILRSGTPVIANIVQAGGGPITPDGFRRAPDHFVVLDGVRWPDSERRWHEAEVHVVCSVKGGYWISADLLLRSHGAAALWVVERPTCLTAT